LGLREFGRVRVCAAQGIKDGELIVLRFKLFFTLTHLNGDHGTQRFTAKIAMGATSQEYQDLAKKPHMDDLSVEIFKLRDRVNAIQRNQDYAKVRALRAWFVVGRRYLTYYYSLLPGQEPAVPSTHRKQQQESHVGVGGADHYFVGHGLLPGTASPQVLPQEKACVVGLNCTQDRGRIFNITPKLYSYVVAAFAYIYA